MTLYVVDAEVAGNCGKSSSASWLVVIQVAKRSNLLPPFGVWIMCFMPLVCGKFSNQRRNPRERLALMRPSRVSFSGCMSVCVCCGTLRLHANIDELVPELGHVSIECWCLKPFASNSNSNSYIKVVACRPLGLSFASGYISIEVDEACPGFTILNTSAAQCKWKINKKNLYSTQPNHCCPHMKLSHSVVCLGNKQKNLRAANMQLVA